MVKIDMRRAGIRKLRGAQASCLRSLAKRRDALLRVLKVRLPLQHIKFALVGPFFWIVTITMTHRVSANIFPLVAVTFRRPKLAIPMVALPNVTFLSADSFREDRFPISHPPFEGWNFGAVWRTEKMNVIRHYDVTADEPRQGLIPGAYNRFMNVR